MNPSFPKRKLVEALVLFVVGFFCTSVLPIVFAKPIGASFGAVALSVAGVTFARLAPFPNQGKFAVLFGFGASSIGLLAGYGNSPVSWAIWIGLGIVFKFIGFVVLDHWQRALEDWRFSERVRLDWDRALSHFFETFKFQSPDDPEERAHVWNTYVKPGIETRAALLHEAFCHQQCLINARGNPVSMPADAGEAIDEWRDAAGAIVVRKREFYELANTLNVLGYLKGVLRQGRWNYKIFVPREILEKNPDVGEEA